MYQVYEILDGDTLESIANRVDITSDEIIRLNGMDMSEFISGNLIVLPKNNMYYTYTVKAGDNLYNIAKTYNQDLNVLYAINGLDEGDYIYPNEEILIPKRDVSIYLTRENDTLDSVSRNLGISVSDIVKNNNNLYLMPEQMIMYKRD